MDIIFPQLSNKIFQKKHNYCHFRHFRVRIFSPYAALKRRRVSLRRKKEAVHLLCALNGGSTRDLCQTSKRQSPRINTGQRVHKVSVSSHDVVGACKMCITLNNRGHGEKKLLSVQSVLSPPPPTHTHQKKRVCNVEP